jgi:hypothetical protein
VFPADEGAGGSTSLSAQDLVLPDHPLLKNWRLDRARLEVHREKLEEIQNSRIILQPMQKRERTESFYREVAAEFFSSTEDRQRWKVRVEDTAWVLYQKGEVDLARRLAGIARDLGNREQEVSRIPFCTALVRNTMEEWIQQSRSAEQQTPSLIVKPS